MRQDKRIPARCGARSIAARLFRRPAGKLAILFTIAACSDSAGPPVPASVVIQPNAGAVIVDDTLRLSATAKDAGGTPITGATFTWLSSDPAIASIDGAGLLTGKSRGDATISAVVGSVKGEAALTVRFRELLSARDTALQGTVSLERLTIPSGVTITAQGPLELRVVGPIVIAGKLLGNCVPLRVRGYDDLTITGVVSNACSDTLAPAFPKLQILTDGALTLDSAEVTSSGGIEVANDSTPAAVMQRAVGFARSRRGINAVEGDPCNLARSFIGPNPEQAKSGARGSPRGGDGLSGNPTELICAGDARVQGVTIVGQRGGSGGPGFATAAEAAVGGKGARGGDAILSVTGNLEFFGVNNRILSGRGGRGGDGLAILTGKPEAQGGDGGDAARPFVVSTLTREVRFTGTLELEIGDPGPGGGASAYGRVGADATPSQAALPGEDAVGRGGNAGSMGSAAAPLRVLGGLLPNAVVGSGNVKVIADASVSIGGEATLVAGRGGAGNAPFPNGAAGGKSHGEGGRGANVFVIDNRAGEAWIGTPGHGGDASFLGGGGGLGYNDCVPGALQPGGRGGAGGISFGTTGRAGATGSGAKAADGNFIYRFLNIGGAGGYGMPLGRGGAGGSHEVEVLGKTDGDALSFKPGTDGNGCPFGAAIDLRPTHVSADHTVGSTACPQALGAFDLVNTGQSNVAWTATRGQNGTAIDFSPGSGTLAAGATAPINVAFNCTQPRSVQTSLVVQAEAQDGSGTAQASSNVTVNVFADAVTLDSPLGSFTAGSVILLSRTQNARLANPDACPTVHLHAQTLEGIRIDGLGPFPDPNPTQCGYGRVTKARVPEVSGQANRITAALRSAVTASRVEAPLF